MIANDINTLAKAIKELNDPPVKKNLSDCLIQYNKLVVLKPIGATKSIAASIAATESIVASTALPAAAAEHPEYPVLEHPEPQEEPKEGQG